MGELLDSETVAEHGSRSYRPIIPATIQVLLSKLTLIEANYKPGVRLLFVTNKTVSTRCSKENQGVRSWYRMVLNLSSIFTASSFSGSHCVAQALDWLRHDEPSSGHVLSWVDSFSSVRQQPDPTPLAIDIGQRDLITQLWAVVVTTIHDYAFVTACWSIPNTA